jgi:SAM-dependent methyltransferase
MCNASCIDFAGKRISRGDVQGRRVLEVGSLDVNGSVRAVIEALSPGAYVGVDLATGPGVDELCDVAQLVERFGPESFELVVSTELVEHVRDWRTAFENMKTVLSPGGTILVTTRSRGFPVHGYPFDYWRYEPEDMARILADFEDVRIEQDPLEPGVLVVARKPCVPPAAASLSDIALFSVIAQRRVLAVSDRADFFFRLRHGPAAAARRAQPVRNRLALRTRVRALRTRARRTRRP